MSYDLTKELKESTKRKIQQLAYERGVSDEKIIKEIICLHIEEMGQTKLGPVK